MGIYRHKATVPSEDGAEPEEVIFEFKPIDRVPVGLARRARGNQEELMWSTLEWGLSPEQLAQFDRLPLSDLTEIFSEWNNSDTDEDKPTGPPKKLKSVQDA